MGKKNYNVVYRPERIVQGKALYDIKKVEERYEGLGPETVPDIKALEGDKSDNIPGVPGVGEKTAIKLLLNYKNLESIYAHIEQIDPIRLRDTLVDNKELAFESRFLATIVRDAPVILDIGQSKFWNFDRKDVVDFMRDLELFSVIPKIPEGRNITMVAHACHDGGRDIRDE